MKVIFRKWSWCRDLLLNIISYFSSFVGSRTWKHLHSPLAGVHACMLCACVCLCVLLCLSFNMCLTSLFILTFSEWTWPVSYRDQNNVVMSVDTCFSILCLTSYLGFPKCSKDIESLVELFEESWVTFIGESIQHLFIKLKTKKK